MVSPCNAHIDKLAIEAEAGANAAGGKAIIFNTITISDGISMGSEGMKYSLVSREVIADSIETVVGCQGMDGFVVIGGSDKEMQRGVLSDSGFRSRLAFHQRLARLLAQTYPRPPARVTRPCAFRRVGPVP